METFLNETQLSEMLQVSLACLRRWRLRGEGPEYVKVGPLVRYRLEATGVGWVDGLPTGGNGGRLKPVGPPRMPTATRWRDCSRFFHRIAKARGTLPYRDGAQVPFCRYRSSGPERKWRSSAIATGNLTEFWNHLMMAPQSKEVHVGKRTTWLGIVSPVTALDAGRSRITAAVVWRAFAW